jgi:hypothetical protein
VASVFAEKILPPCAAFARPARVGGGLNCTTPVIFASLLPGRVSGEKRRRQIDFLQARITFQSKAAQNQQRTGFEI